jgi:ribosomal protein S3
MGQKVHPLGFRVGITKKHQSQWFARFNKYAYSQSVVEDNLLRKTLTNLLPDLLNPVVKKAQKRADQDAAITPKITQIKIERGLIPYEIGIQIHAENCELIKSGIENLKVNRDLVNNLQKTRQYLSRVTSPASAKASNQLADSTTSDALTNQNTSQHSDTNAIGSESSKKRGALKKALGLKKSTKKASRGSGFFGARGTNFGKKGFKLARGKKTTKLSKMEFLKLKTIKKRFKKRQSIRNRYLQLLSKGLLIRKTSGFAGSLSGKKIVRKVSLKGFIKKLKSNKFKTLKAFNNKNVRKGKAPLAQKTNANNNGSGTVGNSTVKSKIVKKLSNKLSKKFANLFINKLNKKFLVTIKNLMRSKYWKTQNENNSSKVQAPLGYSKKWNLAQLKTLKNKPISKLTKLVDILEKKSLQKMESLRKDFFTFGTISKARSFGYYQLITFLKNLKELVNKLKKQNKTNLINKKYGKGALATNFKATLKKKSLTPLTQNVFNKIVKNIDNECRKIQFINYLQNLVKTHRNDNIFYYLSSMAAANKDLTELKRYTKKHANFLFGLDASSLSKESTSAQALQEKIEKVLVQSNKKQDLADQKTLQDTFLDQIENQRKMYKANLALTPKISIKFFSVKTDNVLEKASVVADSIIDALEKRKAFRGVIKKAKEDLMRRSRVKGVKIQVAGRLNGAEIARSEWVRAGRVPLQTLRANIDYSYRTASTIYGIIGVKVWIFKGYV